MQVHIARECKSLAINCANARGSQPCRVLGHAIMGPFIQYAAKNFLCKKLRYRGLLSVL